MADFEVHSIGTAEEIKLSRQLYDAIDQLMEQWGQGIVAPQVIRAHNALLECYMKQLEREQQ